MPRPSATCFACDPNFLSASRRRCDAREIQHDKTAGRIGRETEANYHLPLPHPVLPLTAATYIYLLYRTIIHAAAQRRHKCGRGCTAPAQLLLLQFVPLLLLLLLQQLLLPLFRIAACSRRLRLRTPPLPPRILILAAVAVAAAVRVCCATAGSLAAV
jgi:hypothetical protein